MKSIGVSQKEIAARCKCALSAHTKTELTAMAAEASIDISGCKTKDDIIKAIEAACEE